MPRLVITTEPLQGYRLVFFLYNIYTEDYEEQGASIVSLREAPQTKDEFTEWWRREVSRACQDRVVLVVMKQYDGTNRRKWLQAMEEEEWYNDNGTPSRVRFVTFKKLNMAVILDELLTDDWGENIEKGEMRGGR